MQIVTNLDTTLYVRRGTYQAEWLLTREFATAGVAEMLAMEMKSSGVYVSRGLSYKQAEVRTALTRVHGDSCERGFC